MENQVKPFIKKVLRIRKFLLKQNKSGKNFTAMVSDISFLEKHLDYNNYSDIQIKSFFIRHSNRIYNLLPGTGCKTANTITREYIQLYNYCLNN